MPSFTAPGRPPLLKQRLGGRQLIVHPWKKAVSRQIKSDSGVWATGICFLVTPQGFPRILGPFHSLAKIVRCRLRHVRNSLTNQE